MSGSALHERTARALQAAGDETLAAEEAGHWAAAGRAAEELPARVRAAEAAERVFGYAEAAGHWQRAIELCARCPSPGFPPASICPSCICARSTRSEWPANGSWRLAEEAYRRFAGHPDPATAAAIHLRAAVFRCDRIPGRRCRCQEALRLFEQAPPSAEQAKAWWHLRLLLFHARAGDARRAAFSRALEIAEAAGATGVAPASMSTWRTTRACTARSRRGSPSSTERGRWPRRPGTARRCVEVGPTKATPCSGRASSTSAAEAALRGLQAARETGRETASTPAAAGNAAAALLARAARPRRRR